MKILLFGSTGILGKYINKLLSLSSYNIICIDSCSYDIQKDNLNKIENMILNVLKKNDVIINYDVIKSFKINTIFPSFLQNISKKNDFKFIHIINDVFYNSIRIQTKHAKHTERNFYNKSKLSNKLFEACIIRTSIIGEEKQILEYMKSKKKSEIKKYLNYYWNGITYLTLAKIIKKIIDKNLFWKGIRNIFSHNIVSIYDIYTYINEIYDLNFKINKCKINKSINKCLSSIYNTNKLFKNIVVDIKNQILDQYIFSKQIHIIGKNGFLGKELININKNNNYYFSYSHTNIETIQNNIKNNDIIINCAGISKSNNIDDYYEANELFVKKIIFLTKSFNPYLIHISSYHCSNIYNNSDYVKSKLKGENIIKKYIKKYTILRPCNINGKYCRPYYCNFLITLLYEKKNNIYNKYDIDYNCIKYYINTNQLWTIMKNCVVCKNNNTYNIITNKKFILGDLIKMFFSNNEIKNRFTFNFKYINEKIDPSIKNIIVNNNLEKHISNIYKQL